MIYLISILINTIGKSFNVKLTIFLLGKQNKKWKIHMEIRDAINENYLLESPKSLFLQRKSDYREFISLMYDVEKEIESSLIILNNILNDAEKYKNPQK